MVSLREQVAASGDLEIDDSASDTQHPSTSTFQAYAWDSRAVKAVGAHPDYAAVRSSATSNRFNAVSSFQT